MVSYIPETAQTTQIFNLLQSGTAFNTTVIDQATSVLGHVQGLSDIMGALPNLVNQSGALAGFAGGALTDLQSHMTDMIGQLPQQLSVATAAIGQGLGLGKGSMTDPCSPMGGMFGSLMGGAAKLMDKLVEHCLVAFYPVLGSPQASKRPLVDWEFHNLPICFPI
jgi:hypothetical protein